jgi:hypothetical protein
VAWTEAREGRFTTYTARYEGERWQVLGGASQ